MGKCLGGWRTVPGLVLGAGDVLFLDVLAERVGPVDVARVEFAITAADGSTRVVDVAARSLRRPNFTDSTPPLPGSWGGGPVPRWWHGTSLAMASIAAGRFVVRAVIRANASGSSSDDMDCGELVFWNNRDGSVVLGNTVHLDSVNGNDANSGLSSSAKVRTPHRAFLAVSNGGEAGGGTILMYAGTYDWAQAHFDPATVEVTERWLTWRPAPGVTRSQVKITRGSSSSTWLGNTGTNCWLRFRDVTLVGGGPLVNRPLSTGVGLRIWMDGVRRTNEREVVTHSILAYEGYKLSWCGDNWGNGGDAVYFTACHGDYVWGFDGYTLCMGCLATGYGVALLVPQDNSHASDVLLDDARYYQDPPNSGIPIAGWFDGDINGAWAAAAVGGGVYRFRPTFATTGIHDMVGALPILSTSNVYGMCLRDWNGVTAGMYAVVAYGTDGTGQYVDLDLVGQTPVHTSTSTVVVGRELSPGNVISFLEDIHPDVWKPEGGPRTRLTVDNVRCVNNGGPRGFVGSLTPVTLALIRSCTDSGTQNDWSGTVMQDCLILGCTFLGSWIVDTPGSGCEVRDSYVAGRSFSTVAGWLFANCFFETSSGLSPGGWTQVPRAAAFAADPMVAPYDYSPMPSGPLDNTASRGTGSVGHENGGDSGVSLAVAAGNWSTGAVASWSGPIAAASPGTWRGIAGGLAQWSGPVATASPGAWNGVAGGLAQWSGPVATASAGTWNGVPDGLARWSGPVATTSPGSWNGIAGAVAQWSGPVATASAGAWRADVQVVASWSGPVAVASAGQWDAHGGSVPPNRSQRPTELRRGKDKGWLRQRRFRPRWP